MRPVFWVGMGANANNVYAFLATDLSPCIPGGFLRWCLLEFERLSFAQVSHLQKQWKEFATNELSWKESLYVDKVVHAHSTMVTLLLVLKTLVAMLPQLLPVLLSQGAECLTDLGPSF